MNSKCLLFLLSACIAFYACNNGNEENTILANASATTTDVQIPTIAAPDSVEFYYYPQPQNQKGFETFIVKDTVFINALTMQLVLPAISRSECPHNMKMYLYKNGEVYKTIYAALEDSGSYLAYAVNGQPYFIPMNNAFKKVLGSMIKQNR